jgi:hypothetical protein
MPFLMTYWKQIAIALVIVFAFGSGYYKGYSNQKAKFDAFKAQVEANAKIQKERNELLLKKQVNITENIAKEYANAVKKLNNYYASHRVYVNPTSSGMSKDAKTTSTVDGKTEGDLPSSTRDTTLDCASDVLQLLYLQKWIEDQLLIQ